MYFRTQLYLKTFIDMQFYYLLFVRQVKINKEEQNKFIYLNEKNKHN